MYVYCGIDWASDHHDVALVDQDGALLAKARIHDDSPGLQQLIDLLAAHGDTGEDPIPVAIETSRGLLVACLRATGRPVYAINPMAAARYRDRHAVSRRKSDHLDAMVLANILRTDAAAHRQLPRDSELAQAIAVLAEPSRTRSGIAPRPVTNSAPTCTNTSPPRWRRSVPATVYAPPRPWSSWLPPPPRGRPPSSPAPSCGRC